MKNTASQIEFITNSFITNLQEQRQYLQFGFNSLKYLATKIWDIVPYAIKSVQNLNSLNKKVNWEPKGCHCRLCKQNFHIVGFVDTF